VQLVLKINEAWVDGMAQRMDVRDGSGIDAEIREAMLGDLQRTPKFLFSRAERSRLGYDAKMKFWALDWDLDLVSVEAPEYTVSTQSITFNFILVADTYPQGIVDILQANGFTVTGRHRMGVGLPGWRNTKWEAWDTTLEEAGRRAAWTAEVEQLDQDIAKIEREIRDARDLRAIVSVVVRMPESRTERRSLKIQTFTDFRRFLVECVYKHQDLFGQYAEPAPPAVVVRDQYSVHELIADLRSLELSPDASVDSDVGCIVFSFIFCCQCVFELRMADVLALSLEHVHVQHEEVLERLPKDPFASQVRKRVHRDEVFKSEWMKIIRTIWECYQYAEIEPKIAMFMELDPLNRVENICNDIDTFVGSHEALKTELHARRVDVRRKLAHLHGATVVVGGEAGPGKRKLEQMSALLACFQRMSYA
jgi:hypothetical protein